jgi:glycogen operon protein
MSLLTLPGKSYPLGATVYPTGVNFCLFSKSSQVVELLLFDHPADPYPSRCIQLHPKINKTSHYWHIFVPGIQVGQGYAYRAYGPYAPEQGHRFDGSKVLLDPYAKAVLTDRYDREAAQHPADNISHSLRGVILEPSQYNWEEDHPLRIPYATTVIYELHVGGFTAHPNSGLDPKKRGTYAGLIDRIPYLKALGITAVELLPVQQFDTQDIPPSLHHTSLSNYWGYSPLGFFAPHQSYSSESDPLSGVDEFRDMVKQLHRAGIEVILDVVFNHTAEGNEQGPTLSFRGLENRAYYILQPDPSKYADFSGCGNTFNTNHAIGRYLILDCLRYWVAEMHVDGFRFDLASVMSRDESGNPLANPPILWAIESDPVLAGTKLIAEAWDAAGLYQVGSFIGDRFAEWNGKFRDDVRRFVRGDEATVPALAARILGSPDVYLDPSREPNRSIHFVTCHDGFTLNDLVSYSHKHNQANGEDNRDGLSENFSWNCGLEGITSDPEVNHLRLRQIKNYLTILLLSQGTPMLLMGDEIRRTQFGNNNAYCQNNTLSWFDWSAVPEQKDLLRFVTGLIQWIQTCSLFTQEKRLLTTVQDNHPYILWHGIHLHNPDWSQTSHSLAFTLHDPLTGSYLHVMLNAYWETLMFELPEIGGSFFWKRIVDTSLKSPEDFSTLDTAPIVEGNRYSVYARSSVVLAVAAG